MTDSELNKEVAEQVMGWSNWDGEDSRFTPSTNISDAWMVIEALVKREWQPTMIIRQFEKYPEWRFGCHGCKLFDPKAGRINSFNAKSTTMPRAICLAALEAVQIDGRNGENLK